MKRAAVILVKQHRQIQCAMYEYSKEKLANVQFYIYAVLCHTKIFYSDWVVFAKNFIHELVTVMVVLAIDYATLCGPCTNINILLFSCNKKM